MKMLKSLLIKLKVINAIIQIKGKKKVFSFYFYRYHYFHQFDLFVGFLFYFT